MGVAVQLPCRAPAALTSDGNGIAVVGWVDRCGCMRVHSGDPAGGGKVEASGGYPSEKPF